MNGTGGSPYTSGLGGRPVLVVTLRCVEMTVTAPLHQRGQGDRRGPLIDSSELRRSLFESIRRRIEREEPFVVVAVTAGPGGIGASAIVDSSGETEGTLPFTDWADLVSPAALELLARSQSDSRPIVANGFTYNVFFDSYVPPPRLIIVGAVQTAQSLTRQAKELGYRVIVTDARATFATPERFPEADEVIKGWPQDVLPTLKMDDLTYVVLLSHDPKFDEPTLHYVLKQPVRYIGAIGSLRTQGKRRAKLIDQGFDLDDVARIHGPVGLDLGGKATEEIALSILAEMTAVRYGRSGSMMGAEAGPVA